LSEGEVQRTRAALKGAAFGVSRAAQGALLLRQGSASADCKLKFINLKAGRGSMLAAGDGSGYVERRHLGKFGVAHLAP
jgi:hypothetical protein